MERVGKVQPAPARSDRAFNDMVVLHGDRSHPEHTFQGVAYLGSPESENASQHPLALKHDAHRNKHGPVSEHLTGRSDLPASVVDEKPHQDIGINRAWHSTFA